MLKGRLPRGSGLVGLLLAIAIIAFMVFAGRWYLGDSTSDGSSSIESTLDAKDEAKELEAIVNERSDILQQELNNP